MSEYLEPRDVACPYCGEDFTVVIDLSAGSQRYIEDCAVCCPPVLLDIEIDAEGDIAGVTARRDDE
ncbi:MAG: CPXCG motif-containing cysteine-rich protein [Gammaproteobacteria bacterium]|nr:CPXCG motif-containing cysteine-rich protein [Gammaproteobacteria bacterium]